MSKHTQNTQPSTQTRQTTTGSTGTSRTALMASVENLEGMIRNDNTIAEKARSSIKAFATLLKTNQQVTERTITEQRQTLAALEGIKNNHPNITGALSSYTSAFNSFTGTQNRGGMGNTSVTKGSHSADIRGSGKPGTQGTHSHMAGHRNEGSQHRSGDRGR